MEGQDFAYLWARPQRLITAFQHEWRRPRCVRRPAQSPPIGILLCKAKSRTVVEYALHDARKPIGVATYRTVKRLPRELKGQLPNPEEIAKLLEVQP